jgi:phage gp36-like protein
MPTRYLSVVELVDRIGEQEAIRLTSEVKPPAQPARDDTKIERAIEDSEEEADGYISRRYAMPLATVPKVLKTWIAALAREKLHKTKPTQAVEDAAKLARAQLKEVSIGIFKLLPADDEPPAASTDREALSSGDAPRDSMARQLGDFMDLGGNGYRANWRDRY